MLLKLRNHNHPIVSDVQWLPVFAVPCHGGEPRGERLSCVDRGFVGEVGRGIRQALDQSLLAGPVAFETGETVRLGAAEVPPHTAMVETDTPYLAPPPHRTEQNEPAWVELVGSALAEVWGIETAVVAELTSSRATAVFGASQ